MFVFRAVVASSELNGVTACCHGRRMSMSTGIPSDGSVACRSADAPATQATLCLLPGQATTAGEIWWHVGRFTTREP